MERKGWREDGKKMSSVCVPVREKEGGKTGVGDKGLERGRETD